MEKLETRLNQEDDADIIQAISPYRNRSKRVRQLLRLGIAVEQGAAVSVGVSADKVDIQPVPKPKPNALIWHQFPKEQQEPPAKPDLKANILANNFDE